MSAPSLGSMSDLAMERPDRYFEDYRVGEQVEFGSYRMTEEQIVAFARDFDPQPFHVDKDAARQSVYGGLVASGWHTASAMMRMMVDHFISPKTSMGSPGMDEIRWLKPVRPGDTLRVRVTVLSAKRSTNKPDRGVIDQRVEVINQHGDVVMASKGIGMYRCRTRTAE
jgi:acyl dehydratase